MQGRVEYLSIQYLRAIAALMVVGFHVSTEADRWGYHAWRAPWLASGVDIFFVISGFIMWVTTAQRMIAPADFYWKRLTRIAPLYWLLTTCMVVALLLVPKLAETSRFDPYLTLSSFLFWPAWNEVQGARFPVLLQGWTLNYEMFFYLIFGAALLISDRAVRILIVALWMGSLVLIGLFIPDETIAGFYTNPIILEFVIGCALGDAFLKGWRLTFREALNAIGLGMFLLAALTMLFPNGTRALVWGIPAALIVAGVVSLEGRVAKHGLLALLGDASYSIYLSHGVLMTALALLWARTGLNHSETGVALFFAAGLLAAAVCGAALFLLVERPINRALKRAADRLAPA